MQLNSDDLQEVAIRQWWERGVGLGLVPEGYARNVVLEGEISAAGAPANRLDGDLEIGFEADRVHHVPPVKPEALLHLVVAIASNYLR